MLWHMRTTVILPDALADKAKRLAAEQGRTFTSLIEEGVRHVLEQPRETSPIDLPTHGGAGGRVLIDLSDRDAVWAALDADDTR